MIELLPTLVGYMLFVLAGIHALRDGRANRPQRLLLLLTLFFYGTLLEAYGVGSGHYSYPREQIINLGVVPLSVSLAWVGIIYSVMMIAERLKLRAPLRILSATFLALSLDWGMDPIAARLGIWVWNGSGAYFGIPSFNMVGWFLVPVFYLMVYGFSWDRARRRVRLLSIGQIEEDRSVLRRVYTLLLVAPLSLVLLTLCATLLTRAIPALQNLSLPVMAVWAILTVGGTLGIIVWRRDRLRRRGRSDVMPGLILAWISFNYMFFAAAARMWTLAVVMTVASIPIWAAFVISLLPVTAERQLKR